jgi:hypothetical protein
MFRQDVALLSPAEQEEEGAPAKVIAAAVLMPLLFRVFRRLLQDASLLSSLTQRASTWPLHALPARSLKDESGAVQLREPHQIIASERYWPYCFKTNASVIERQIND